MHKNLLEKNYEQLDGINSLDSVLMYMPNEEAFHAAASVRNDIILNAGKNKGIKKDSVIIINSDNNLIKKIYFIN